MADLVQWFHDELYNKYDRRTSEWFLVSRPGLLVGIVMLYLYFSLSMGPRYMKNRQPYNLHMTLIVYNLSQICLSTYLFYEGLMAGWLYDYSYSCQPVDYSDSPSAIRMAAAVHLYFICKIIELLDTVFFVLRKKQGQISFLHVYHHATMPFLSWVGVRFFPGGHPTLLGLLNSFVHIFMYTYYLLTSFGPKVKKYLWWKKYLTILQMVQFLIVAVHNVQVFFNDCDYSKSWSIFATCDSILFIYMFGLFYVKNNIKRNSHDSMTSGVSLKAD